MAQNLPEPDRFRDDDPSERHPTMRLHDALSTLRSEPANHRVFQNIVDRRAKARRVHDNLLDVASQIAKSDANRLIVESHQPTGPFDGGPVDELARMAAEPIPSNEPEDFLDHPRRILANLSDGAERGLQALREGGGEVLNDSLGDGTDARLVKLRMKLDEVTSMTSGLVVGIENLNVVMDDGAQTRRAARQAAGLRGPTGRLGRAPARRRRAAHTGARAAALGRVIGKRDMAFIGS